MSQVTKVRAGADQFDVHTATAAPAAPALIGSITIRLDATATAGVFLNTDGATQWRQLMAAGGAVTFDTTVNATWTLRDTQAASLVIGSATFPAMQTFNTVAGSVDYAARVTTTDGVTAGTARVVGGRAFSSTADSTEIVQAAGGYVAFDVTYSIPADTLKAGSRLHIRAVVRITTILNGGATLQAQLRLGGAALITTPDSTAGAAGTRCLLEAWLTTRAAPGAAVATSGVTTGIWSDTVAVVTTAPGAGVAIPTFATNGALVVDVAAESSAAGDGSGRIVLEQLDVEIV